MKKTLIFIFLFILSFIQSVHSQQIKLKTGWYSITSSENDLEMTLKNTQTKYHINTSPVISIENFKTSKLITSKTRPYNQIEIKYDNEGSKIWETETDKLAQKEIGFICDNELLEVVMIMCKISSGKVSFGVTNVEKFELKKINTSINREITSLNKN